MIHVSNDVLECVLLPHLYGVELLTCVLQFHEQILKVLLREILALREAFARQCLISEHFCLCGVTKVRLR